MGTRRPPRHLRRVRPWEVAVTGDTTHHRIRTVDRTSTNGARSPGDDPEGQATSQASGMLSVSRVRPIPTAISASAGPVTRWSSARVRASATLT